MGKNDRNNCFLFLHVCNNSKKLGTVGGNWRFSFSIFFTSCLWASSITNIVQYMLNVLSQMLQLIEIPNCYYDYYCSCSKSWFQFTCYIYWYLQMFLSTRVRAFLLPWYRSLFLVLREVISKVVNSSIFLMKNVCLFARKIKSFSSNHTRDYSFMQNNIL